MTENNLSQSISGPERFSYWAKVTGLYLITSLSVASALIRIFELYTLPSKPEDIMPRLILAAAIIILLSTALCVTIHLTISYKRRYHLQRDRGLVRDLYPDRTHLIGHYGSVLSDAQEVFRVVGISLHTLMSDNSFLNGVRKALSDKPKLQISLVFMKPYSSYVELKERLEGRPSGRISSDCLVNFNKALEIKNSLGEISKRLHVYQINTVPAGFILQRDAEIYFEPYLDRQVGRTCPTLVFQENENNKETFGKFVSHIDNLISSVKESEFSRPEHGVFLTEFGKKGDRRQLNKALFFDRDGVLIEDPGYLSKPEQIKLYPSTCQTITRFNRNYRIIVVTNQSAVAQGIISEPDLFEIHKRLTSILEDNDAHIDAIYYCPHHPEKGIGGYRIDCKCRKPKSGLIEAAAKDYGINLSSSYLIGDSERDIKAGNTVGVKTLLMAHDKTKIVSTEAAHVITDLSELKSLIHP